MSNITGNQGRNSFTLGRVAQSVGDYFTRIKRYEEAKEEYRSALLAFSHVPHSSPDFAKAQKNKAIMQRYLLVDLSQWRLPIPDFTQAITAGWLTLEDILGTQSLAFRTITSQDQTIKRAKRIIFNVEQTVALVVELTPLENQTVDVLLHVGVIEPQTELPENLTLILLSETGQPLDNEIRVGKHCNYIKQSIKGTSGEQFSVKLILGEISIIEDFIL